MKTNHGCSWREEVASVEVSLTAVCPTSDQMLAVIYFDEDGKKKRFI